MLTSGSSTSRWHSHICASLSRWTPSGRNRRNAGNWALLNLPRLLTRSGQKRVGRRTSAPDSKLPLARGQSVSALPGYLKHACRYPRRRGRHCPKDLLKPALRGSAAATATFWASAERSFVWSDSVSNCLREYSAVNSRNSDGDLAPESFLAKLKPASVLPLANSITLALYSWAPLSPVT